MKKAAAKSAAAAVAKRRGGKVAPARAAVGGAAAAKKGGGGAAKGKKGGKSKGGKPKPPKAETAAASVLQRAARCAAARRALPRKRAAAAAFAAEMAALKRAALEAQLLYERKQQVKEQKRNLEIARRREAAAQLRRDLFDAAADGAADELAAALASDGAAKLDVGAMRSGAGDTLLLEAAASGSAACVAALVGAGADVNATGNHGRTPLWRAAFGLHTEAVVALLAAGADPRTCAADGSSPAQVCSHAPETTAAALAAWDVSETDRLLRGLAARQETRRARVQEERQSALGSLGEQLRDGKEEHKRAQQMVRDALVQVRARIADHDYLLGTKGEGAEELLAAAAHIGKAEARVEEVRLAAGRVGERLSSIRAQMREALGGAEGAGGGGGGGEEEDGGEERIPGVKIGVHDLNEVLARDVGGAIRASGKHPLVIDGALLPGMKTRTSVFLKYHDCNYLSFLDPKDMEPEAIRLALLGAIRFGKPAVLEMADLDVGLAESVAPYFDAVRPGLWRDLLSKELLRGEAYLQLLRPGDERNGYKPELFAASIAERFSFVLLSFGRVHSEEWWRDFYPIEVVTKT